jgi:hypothetical protein
MTCLEQSGGVPIAFMAAAVWIIRLPKATASASLAKSKSGARLVERVRSGTARAKATGTKRPNSESVTLWRVLGPGFHKIAAQFGVATGTVQRIAHG